MNKPSEQISIPTEHVLPILREPDGQAFLIHFTGGLRASQVDKNSWMIQPVLNDNKPSKVGLVSRNELEIITQKAGYLPIAFQSLMFINGEYQSFWTPIVPNRKNHFQGPADLWASIAANITKIRTHDRLKSCSPSIEKYTKILDKFTPEEALTKQISYSLRSLDVSLENIVAYYYDQLVNMSFKGAFSGELVSTTSDIILYTHIHAFFLHFGTARDYLGAYLALKTGNDIERVDDMVRLVNKLQPSSFENEPILNQLRDKGFIVKNKNNPSKWQLGGWLKDASNLRRRFVHKRPYGTKFSESHGKLIVIDKEAGLMRYFRPIQINNRTNRDALDEIVLHYKQCIEMFQDAAEVSGQDFSTTTITEADIVKINSD